MGDVDDALIGGRERRRIEIVDYDPHWPDAYEQHRARVAAALGGRARRIEHIGSTAVPGLAAKPIVDVLVTVGDADEEGLTVPALTAAGYELRVREPGHRVFRTPERDVHVHIWSEGHPDVARQIAFRDRLRESSGDRRAYERLKRDLARREWSDMDEYADAKGPFIESVLARVDEEGRP